MLGERTSYKALGCCGLIIAGFFLGLDQEKALGTLSLFGASCGIASSIFVALNAIYTTRCLPCVDKNVWRLCLYNNFNACILFLPLMLIFGEIPVVFNYSKIFNIPFWFAMSVAGFLGFSMGYVTGYQIQMTSPLTHNVSGTAKSYVQTLIAVIVYIEVRILKILNNLFFLFFVIVKNNTLVDIKFICSWWIGFICTCSSNRNETKSYSK
jgi:GDP-fucose transporter C1